MVGYYNEFTVAQRQIVYKLFVKDNLQKIQGMNPIGLSAPRSNSLEITALKKVKKLQGINPMGLSDPRSNS